MEVGYQRLTIEGVAARARGSSPDIAGRGDLPADVDAALLHDVYAGTLFYRALMRREHDRRVVDKLTDLLLDGRVPRT